MAKKKITPKKNEKAKKQSNTEKGSRVSGNDKTGRKNKPKTTQAAVQPSKRELAVLAKANTGKRQLRTADGRFISKQATEIILKQVRKSRSKEIDINEFLNSPEVKGFVKTRIVHQRVASPSLAAVIDNNEYESSKYIHIDIDGIKTNTKSDVEIKILIHQSNTKLYDILELIEENEGEIESPQFLVKVKMKLTQNKTFRLIEIDYTSDKICPQISPELWRDYKDEYILMNFEDDYEESKTEKPRTNTKGKAVKKTKKGKGNKM